MATRNRTASWSVGSLSVQQPARSKHGGLSEPLRRHATLSEQVRAALRNAILSLQFQPGQRITESMLCHLTGVSRTVVREALRHSESEGLVEHIPGRGMFITDFSADRLQHCYEIYGAIEGQAARTFAQRASSETIARLKFALNDMLSARRAQKTNGLLVKVNSFHDILLTECTNPLIQRVLTPIDGRIRYFRKALSSKRGAMPDHCSELAEIVDAIQNHNAEMADLASRRYSASECAAVLAVMHYSQNI